MRPLLYFAVIAGMLGVYGYFVMLRDSATDVRVDPVCMADCKSGCDHSRLSLCLHVLTLKENINLTSLIYPL